jgi:hypothetical protein
MGEEARGRRPLIASNWEKLSIFSEQSSLIGD